MPPEPIEVDCIPGFWPRFHERHPECQRQIDQAHAQVRGFVHRGGALLHAHGVWLEPAYEDEYRKALALAAELHPGSAVRFRGARRGFVPNEVIA